MTTPQGTVVGRGLGGELRRLREASDLSCRQAAERLGWQGSKISRMETGNQGIRVEDVASLLVVYGVTGDERSRLLAMAERSGDSGWWDVFTGLSDESKTLIQFEAEATGIIDFEPLLVPGLLQTAEYARAIMKACGVNPADTEGRVSARMARQAILTRDEPPALTALLDEQVLRRSVGGSKVMAKQLRHMIELSTYENVNLRILPLSIGGHSGLDGSFALLDFARNKPVVHLEHKLSGLFLEEPEQVELYRREATRLVDVALDPAASVKLVNEIAAEHDRE